MTEAQAPEAQAASEAAQATTAVIADPGGRFVGLTESAVKRVAELKRQEGQDDLMLRLAVSGGGCSGFQYGFSFDDARNDDDFLFERGGVQLVIDDVSLDLLAGSEVDFVEDLIGAASLVRTPNASFSSGCRSSVAVFTGAFPGDSR